ncbi:gas vesicle protein GvpN [Alkalihalobacterium elongatum]|uniref:gas vesicle protein GvpN n=1 Tax=Alkalihalobacterium elongatum TaxID=2675466 RepID=UPI001C1F20AE|nr:gas vesicle protein GvpN [Alkalihalobacterium elongatum]
MEQAKGKNLEKIILSPQLESIVHRALTYMRAGYPIHFMGPTGVGKTELSFYLAHKLNRPCSYIQGNHELSNIDLLGGSTGFKQKKIVDNYIHTVYKSEQEQKELWTDGPLLDAAKKGSLFIYDEFNRSKPETNNLLLSVLQERSLILYGKKAKEKLISVHPNFSVVFTSNPEEYTGIYKTQDALLDRMITFRLQHYDNKTETLIVSKKTGISKKDAEAIVKIVSYARTLYKSKHIQAPSIRSSLMIATIAQKNHIKIDISSKHFLLLCEDILYTPISKDDQVDPEELLSILIEHIRGWDFEK